MLHDIGHLVDDVPDDFAEWTRDQHHERVGAAWLAQRFGPDVSEPVRLHVPAKRYLCATEAGYFGNLSPASVRTLQLQGGPMPAAEIAAFEKEPYCREAVRVRRWDDRAKIADLKVPGLCGLSHAHRNADPEPLNAWSYPPAPAAICGATVSACRRSSPRRWRTSPRR